MFNFAQIDASGIESLVWSPPLAKHKSSSEEYSPLIFKISLFTINESDHDFDGILSKNEDIDKDGDPLNDDSNGNSIPDMYDNDDDGDGILTKNEYDQNKDGIPDDSDSDLIPDYLDTEG